MVSFAFSAPIIATFLPSDVNLWLIANPSPEI
jgi:hypothetical protein